MARRGDARAGTPGGGVRREESAVRQVAVSRVSLTHAKLPVLGLLATCQAVHATRGTRIARVRAVGTTSARTPSPSDLGDLQVAVYGHPQTLFGEVDGDGDRPGVDALDCHVLVVDTPRQRPVGAVG